VDQDVQHRKADLGFNNQLRTAADLANSVRSMTSRVAAAAGGRPERGSSRIILCDLLVLQFMYPMF
jgi:hypothetical protein